jgi:hypothetical protein
MRAAINRIPALDPFWISVVCLGWLFLSLSQSVSHGQSAGLSVRLIVCTI